MQHRAEIVEDVGVGGQKRQDPAITGFRLLQPALGSQGVAEIGLGGGGVRADAQQMTAMGFGIGGPSLMLGDFGQTGDGVGVIASDRHGTPVEGLRLIDLSPATQDGAEIAQGLGKVGA